MIKISPRLEAIATLVPINSNVIDIGCDHGLLDIYLYQKRISPKIIASDINSLALNNAKENIKRNHLEGIIETRLGNGLDSLNQEDNIDTNESYRKAIKDYIKTINDYKKYVKSQYIYEKITK